jgi:adenylate cyclase
MSDIFISYARSQEAEAGRIGEALRALGYGVWRDDELPAHRDYAEVIEERLRAAKAVVVVWSAEAVKSQWVRAEADLAREAGTLVQLSVDGSPLPMPFNRIQCADLKDWHGDADLPGWRKVRDSVADLIGRASDVRQVATTAQIAANDPAPALPDKPSIAVLPFMDLSGHGEQDYFAEGMVAEIATGLSRFRSLFVISSGTSLAYRGDKRGPKPIGRELGVRYLVEGSIRRSGERVRIGAEVVDAADGQQVWAEKFDGVMDDIFGLQDEIAQAIASQVELSITTAEVNRVARRAPADQTTYDLYLRARYLYLRQTTDAIQEAGRCIDEMLTRDPDFAPALALDCGRSSLWSFSPDNPEREDARRRAVDSGRRAVSLAPEDSEVLAVVATSFVLLGENIHVAADMAKRAVALNPGSAMAWFADGSVKVCVGESQAALASLETGLRLDPRSPFLPTFRLFQGDCLFFLHRFGEAIAAYADILQVVPTHWGATAMTAACHAQEGRLFDARALLGRVPAPFLETAIGFFHKPEDRALIREGFALAVAEN